MPGTFSSMKRSAARRAHEADRRQDRRLLGEAGAYGRRHEALERRCARSRPAAAGSARPRAPSSARARRGSRPAALRVLDRAEEEVRRRVDLAAREVAAARASRVAVTSSWIESRSKTRRASGSSPAVTSSPVRQQMFSIPCSAAPAISASSASRLRSRQTSCMIGSMPSCCSAIATASGDACACAAVLSVALTASTQSSYGAKRSRTASRPPLFTVRSSAVSDEAPRRRLLPQASTRHPFGRDAVALRQVVGPRRGAPEAVVDRLADVVDLVRPRRLRRALDRLHPDAAHLGLHLAVAVGAHAAARPVAQRLRAVHRARHAGRVQHALAAHLAAEDRLLDRGLDEGERLHAGTAERFFSIRSFASRTAVDASAA